MLKTNKQRIQAKLQAQGFEIGCYDNNLEKLNDANLRKVLKKIPYGGIDIPVFVSRKPCIVEVLDVDAEYDFKLWDKESYQSQYGHQYDEDFGW